MAHHVAEHAHLNPRCNPSGSIEKRAFQVDLLSAGMRLRG